MSDNEQPLNRDQFDVECGSCEYKFTVTNKLGGDRCPECGSKYDPSILTKKLKIKAQRKQKSKERAEKKYKERLRKEKEDKDRAEKEKLIRKIKATSMADFLEYVNSNINEEVNYVNLHPVWIEECEQRFVQILKAPLSDWTKFQKEFYLKFKDYPGRNEYFDCVLKSVPNSSEIEQKLDAIIKILAESVKGREKEIREIQKRLGRQVEAQEMSVKAAHANFLMDHMGE